MSRIIQQIATVQFQVDNRKVTASMNALQTEAESLNGKIAAVNQSIKALGDVPADNKFLLEYQKQLRQLNSDLKDVTTAQRDLMKGVKAADQLWKAARTQDIESLSIKAIKAGQNGLRKRMENLRPELGGDEQKMYDAYKAVIDEADRVMNVFKSNYATVVQTIRDGGIVSEQAMKSTRDALRDLMESEKEGTAEHRQLAQQYDFLNESLANVAEMRRREKGEIVNASDARREALKLTEDGIAAARRERDMADAVIAGMQQEKSDLDQLRRFHEDRIAQTEREIAANQRLEEAEQDHLADVEKAMRYVENEDRKEAIRLRKKADAARDEAEAKKEAYEQQAEQEKLLRQHVKDTGDEVTNLTAKIEALGKTEAKPKVDTSDIDEAQRKYTQAVKDRQEAQRILKEVEDRTYEESPRIKQLNEEIAKIEELIAVSDKYKKQFVKMSDESFEKGFERFEAKESARKNIWDAQKYLEEAYNDKLLKAPLAHMEELPDNPAYKAAAKRVADGIMQNAQENVRRVIFDEIKNGNWSPEQMGELLESMRSQMNNAGNSELGLKDNPEYNAYKYIVAQMEKYLEVAKKVQEERKQMAGSDPYLKVAQHEPDYDKDIWPESLSRQKEKREFESLTGWREWDKKKDEDWQQASSNVQTAVGNETRAFEELKEAKKQSTTATNDQTEAIKKQEEELGKLEQKLKRLEESRDDYQNDVKESLKAVKDMGLTEEDLADDAKVREAVEKKVLEIMEAQAKVGQEIAEQRKKLAGEVKMSDLGGTKADEKFYAENKDRWDVSDYASPDDMIERIAHLERLKKLKNGKRFNPDEDWEDDDELDEDAPIMSDKEKQVINDELRFLKQHIREELLKTIHEVGDINKAVEQYTGGDGVSEDAKFGEQLNDKISEIKDKIEESIETTIDRYGEMLNEDRDIDSKMTKEQLTSRVSKYMESVKENHGFNRSWLEETQGDIETTKGEIESKKQLIDQMKQQAQATKESTQTDQQSVDVTKQKAELEGQLADATMNHTKAVKDYEAQQEKTNKAQEKAYKAQEESVALNEKAAKAEEDVAHQEERHSEAMDHQSERLRKIRAEGERLLTQWEQQKSELQTVDKAWADADVKQGEAEARKAQNQELTTKSIEDSIRKLKEANAVIDANSDEWEENTRIIRKLQQAQDEISQKQKEMMGEWMSYAEAEKFAAQAGTEGFIATGQQMQQAQQALERRRDALIKSIQVRRQEKNMTDEQKNALAAEEAQLKKVNAELKKMKFEMDNTNMSAKRMNEILDNPASAKNIEELGQAVKRAQAQLKMMEDTVGNTNKEYQEMAQKTKEAAQRQKELEVQFKASASAFDKAWSRLKTYVGLYVGASVAMNKLMGTMGDLMDLSDKMGEVRKTTGFTADEVGRLSGELKKLDTRTTLNGLLDLSVAAGQLGLKTEEDVLGFTEAANKLMVALPEMGREGATEMLKVALATGEIDKIRKQMQEGLIDGSSATAVAMEKVGSTIDRLRATSAATAPAITDFVKRVGAVGAQSGITIDQVAALGSTVDALGMRVEMSATALSRMIPAIKNNAFAVAKAIGVTPETLRSLFDAGKGMEAILMIFDHIKKSGMDEDSIEKMLGMGGMQEVMKELNQMGARAGIVFAGLSQNVDELRRQLGVAGEAYEKNIAIQQEYDKMNETTMAKWQRFKNDIEEMFVSDRMQRWLGDIIDTLRTLVKWFAADGPLAVGFKMMLMYAAAMRMQFGATFAGMGGGLKNLGLALGAAVNQMGLFTRATANARAKWKELDGAVRSNIWGAVIAALATLAYKLWDIHQAAKAAAAEVGRFNQKMADEKRALDSLFEPLSKQNLAQKDRAALMAQINSTYGKYLGYMVSETMSATQLAEAHALIAKRIREEAYERRIMEKERQIYDKHDEDVNAAYGGIESAVRGGAKGNADVTAIADMMKGFVDKNMNAIVESGKTLPKGFVEQINGMTDRLVLDGKLTRQGAGEVRTAMYKYLDEAKEQAVELKKATSGIRSDLRSIQGAIQTDLTNNLRGLIGNIASLAKQPTIPAQAPAPQGPMKPQQQSFTFGWGQQKQNGSQGWGLNFGGQQQQQPLQMPLPGQKPKIDEKNTEQVRQYIQDQDSLRSFIKEHAENISESDRKAAEAWLDSENEIERLRKVVAKRDTSGGGGGTNPWGSNQPAESTDWKNMTAEQLVNRRKQMKDFVNAIQTDTDVQSVLKEDAALKKAIENGMSSDMRTVIEWYNTERLKIQDELHARHLTNTGDWMDPKKQKSAKKQFRDEMDAYLHELDAYYTERKTRIEEAGTDEGLTEAEISNRTLNNEMEWQQRRAELQKLYSRKQKEVTQEELDAIYHIIAERTGDSESFVKAQIAKTNQFVDSIEKSGEKGAAIVHRWMSQVELDTERSYLKGQQALTKQMKAIQDIIDKERPFNGITNSLQESLATMDILTGEMRKEYNELMKQGKDTADFNARQAQEEMKRTAFLLGEAENAYSTTIDNVMDDMRQKGMTAWADWLSADPKLQEALMAQLRSTYDAIQDAINKEASQLKKQAEIMWNNILMPDGKTTLKQTTDRIVAQLGLDEGRVNRANSLIGAGQASERVADKLAIQQMKVQLAMQEHYYNLMRKQGQAHVDMLNAQAKAAKERGDEEEATRKTLDAQHAQMSLNLATAKEETELAKQREDIIARTEESQNRLYTELKEWGDLLASSMRELMEASNAGNAEYYNERAKLELTGKGGPGAGTYVVIDDAGTSDAKAHYEYLDERAALERQHEIEQQNARAEAWKKVWDDLNAKMNEQITDWMNSYLQNESIDANTGAVNANTAALNNLTMAMQAQSIEKDSQSTGDHESNPTIETIGYKTQEQAETAASAESMTPVPFTEEGLAQRQEMAWAYGETVISTNEQIIESGSKVTEALADQFQKQASASQNANRQMQQSTQSTFAKMTAAANLYGIAYQAMSNDNLSTAQKFEMFALQAAGQAAISMLTMDLAAGTAKNTVQLPGILGKLLGEMPYPAAMATFAAVTALLGGLMGVAVSQVSKSKSQIAQVSGASASAGKLTTGMLAYAEGNVNEFTDPGTLTPGRQYNVDAADGRTYRARYMGSNPKTHLTNGPEFHLSGERGREMIIDAGTTRQITMNDGVIWHAIQTLSAGGRLAATRRRGRGVRAFADGNVEDFESVDSGQLTGDSESGGLTPEQVAAFQSSLDRNSEVMERVLEQGIHAYFDVYGKGGLVDSYDTGKKTVTRHGERY